MKMTKGEKKRCLNEDEDSQTIGELLAKQKEKKNKEARTIVEKVLEKLQKNYPPMENHQEYAQFDDQIDHRDTTSEGDKHIHDAGKENRKNCDKRVKHVASKTKLNDRKRKELLKIKKELNVVRASYNPPKPKRPQARKQLPVKPNKIVAIVQRRKRASIEEGEIGKQPKKQKSTSYQLEGSTSKSSAPTTITATRKKKEIKKKSEANDFEDAQPRAGPLKFMNFVAQLTEEKKQAVREIGFGALLSIDFSSGKRIFNKSLLESFDPESSSLLLPLGKIVEIEEDDVEIVFGLPRGDYEIEEPTFQQYSPEFRQFLADWRESWGLDPIRGSPKTANIMKRYTTELKDGPPDDQFILHFVICAVNCLMVSTSSNDCYFKFLSSLMDISKIKSVNWCKFVHQQLIKTVKHFKHAKPNFYTGPLSFLTLCYFNRIQRQGIVQPRKTPLVSTWTKNMIQKRLTIEVEDGFGRGKLLDRIVLKSEFPREVEDKGAGVHQNTSTSRESEVEVFLVNFFNLLKIIGPHVKELGSLVAEAEMLFPDSSLLNKTAEFLGKMIKEGKKEPRSILSQDEEIYCSDSFLDEVSRLEKSFMDELKRKKRNPIPNTNDFDPFKMFDLGIDSSPAVTNATTSQQRISPVVTSRSQDASQPHCTKNTELPEPTNTKLPEPTSPDQTVNLTLQLGTPTFQGANEESINDSNTGRNSVAHVDEQFPTNNLDETEDVVKMFESHGKADNNKEQMKETKTVVLQGFKVETRPRREVMKLTSSFSSPYMVQFRDMFRDMNTMKAAISDYAFGEGDPLELLYYDGFYSINRSEMQTLVGDEKVMNCVVDVWVSLLNYKVKESTNGRRDKVYLSLDSYFVMCTHEICKENATNEERIGVLIQKLKDEIIHNNIESISNLKMIFIPVLSHYHYFLMCVHIEKSKIFVIDNRKLPHRVNFKSKYGDGPKEMLKVAAEFLKTKNISYTSALLDYQPKLVKMSWRSSKDDKNCGVYMMHHMETFNGEEEWECDFKNLNTVEALVRLRVRYCSEIILSDKNKMKNRVMSDARRRRLDMKNI